MKFSRLVAVFLILVLTTSQALAAVCSASCLMGGEQHTQLNTAPDGDLVAYEHCQHDSDSSDQHHPKKTACSIAGCHLAQTAAFPPDSQQFLFKTAVTDFPRFISTAVSADLPPPIKPPA